MKRRRGRRRGGINKLAAGAIALAAIVLITYLGFTKFANPFASPYTAHVIFANANGLQPSSLVRIAGVNVGKVQSVQPVASCKSVGQTPEQCSAADVTMTFQSQGLPLHKDATFAIRPRIFLEGNFFVDVRPGSPESPVAPSGYVFPIQSGTEPVQFDQILTSLQSDTRRNLQILLQQYGVAVKQGGPSYNSSIQYWTPAYEYSSIVAHDSLGLQPHDLSNAIYKQGDVSSALDTHPQNLESLVTDFNTTAHAFAVQSSNLQAAVAELPKTLQVAIPALNALNAVFCTGTVKPNCAPGSLQQFANALIPGVKSTPAMVNASLPFITQLRLLVQPSELGGLTSDLATTIPALTKLTKETIPLLRNEVQPAAGCVVNDIYPWSQLTLNDPHFNASNGFPPHKVYVEAVDDLPGLAGESRDFDANGMYIRIIGALGDTGVTSLGNGLVGGTLAPIMGAEPQEPPGGKEPPFEPNVPCQTQPAISNLNATTAGAPAQYPATSILPPSLVSILQKVPLPLGLSKDVASAMHKQVNVQQPTPAQRAKDRQTLEKSGLWELYPSSNSSPLSQSTSTLTKANTAR